MYELHLGTRSPEGTFDGTAARLDALVDLGVTHVELMPVAAFPGDRGTSRPAPQRRSSWPPRTTSDSRQAASRSRR